MASAAGSGIRSKNMNKDICVRCGEGVVNIRVGAIIIERTVNLFGDSIFAYYYDLPFEETLRRHKTKANRFDFGEEEMRRWWNEKDYIGFIQETILTEEMSLAETVQKKLSDVRSKDKIPV